jgi:hypothetical protein
LIVFGEIAATSANRFGFGDLECADVLVYGVAIFQLRGSIADQVRRLFRAQQIGLPFRVVESDGQRISHVGHQREVEQFGDVDLIVQPACVGPIMRGKEFGDLAALAVLVVAPVRGRFSDRDLGLLFQPIPFQPPVGPAFVGRGDRPHAPADRAAEREDQPPEIRSEMKRAHLARMPSRHTGFDPVAFAHSRTPKISAPRS